MLRIPASWMMTTALQIELGSDGGKHQHACMEDCHVIPTRKQDGIKRIAGCEPEENQRLQKKIRILPEMEGYCKTALEPLQFPRLMSSKRVHDGHCRDLESQSSSNRTEMHFPGGSINLSRFPDARAVKKRPQRKRKKKKKAHLHHLMGPVSFPHMGRCEVADDAHSTSGENEENPCTLQMHLPGTRVGSGSNATPKPQSNSASRVGAKAPARTSTIGQQQKNRLRRAELQRRASEVKSSAAASMGVNNRASPLAYRLGHTTLGSGTSQTCNNNAGFSSQNVALFPRPFSQAPTISAWGPSGCNGMYALDDSLLCGGVKERQSASCFPKQSARDACQGILEAISKFRDYQRRSKSSTVTSACTADVTDRDESFADTRSCNGNSQGSLLHVLLERSVFIGSAQANDPAPQSFILDNSGFEINLDHILSHAPYRDMLQDLFLYRQAAASSSPGSTTKHAGCNLMSIPIVTRMYEESFMREPMWDHEAACVMGARCECNFISPRACECFTGVQFTLPSDSCSMDDPPTSPNVQPDSLGLCVLCHRKRVQGLFYDIVYSGKPCHGTIQRYGNICNVAGEYAREVMLIFPPSGPVECMPLPCVSHQRNRYSVFSKGGARYIKQSRVAWEDFCQAPLSLAVP